MSERVFLEAKGLEDDKRLVIRQFETDKAKIKATLAQIEDAHKSLGDLIAEATPVKNQYSLQLQNMIDARQQKVDENNKIVTDAETVVIKTIKVARSKLTGIKMKLGVLKFKDGPHL